MPPPLSLAASSAAGTGHTGTGKHRPSPPRPEPARGSPGTRRCCRQHRALVSPSFGTEIRARQSHRGGSCSVPTEDSGEGWMQLLPGVWGCSSSSIPWGCLLSSGAGRGGFSRRFMGSTSAGRGGVQGAPPEQPGRTRGLSESLHVNSAENGSGGKTKPAGNWGVGIAG